MPVVFIHGVNTREGDNYRADVAARNELLQRLVLDPLAKRGGHRANMKIVNPYWGSHGVRFRWDLASLPDVNTLEDLGANDSTPEADVEFASTVRQLAGSPVGASRLERLGGEQGQIKAAANADLERYMEAVLSPIILSETRLAKEGESPEEAGINEALLMIAAQDVALDPDVRAGVAAAVSDQEVMDILRRATEERVEQLSAEKLPGAVAGGDEQPVLERLGAIDWLKDRVGEFFDRAEGAPLRAATIPALDLLRGGLHRKLGQFLGDVFVYLNERGTKEEPGPIVTTVLDAVQSAPRQHENEPLIVITHSMGGNILYDLLTFYAPQLEIDAWISVAAQVGQFEEMKLFQASVNDLGTPNKISGLKPRLKFWLNLYDPADVLAFKAAPVFADVDVELPYLTGESAFKSHGAYFKRPSLYRLIEEHLRGVIQ